MENEEDDDDDDKERNESVEYSCKHFSLCKFKQTDNDALFRIQTILFQFHCSLYIQFLYTYIPMTFYNQPKHPPVTSKSSELTKKIFITIDTLNDKIIQSIPSQFPL